MIPQPSASQPKPNRSRRKTPPSKNRPRRRQAGPAASKQRTACTAGTACSAEVSRDRGSEGQAQIAAQAPQGTAQNTEQLLQTAEGNLRKVTRQLSDGEQAMLRQARTYIAQSRSASQDGDLERAYNLAMKANLLSGELAK